MGAYLYILKCSDGSYYVGTTRATLEHRLSEHNEGVYDGYTKARRPVSLVFSEHFEEIRDAIAAERQVKGWSRKKKEALINRDYGSLPMLARRRHRGKRPPRPSRRDAAPSSASRPQPQDEEALDELENNE